MCRKATPRFSASARSSGEMFSPMMTALVGVPVARSRISARRAARRVSAGLIVMEVRVAAWMLFPDGSLPGREDQGGVPDSQALEPSGRDPQGPGLVVGPDDVSQPSGHGVHPALQFLLTGFQPGLAGFQALLPILEVVYSALDILLAGFQVIHPGFQPGLTFLELGHAGFQPADLDGELQELLREDMAAHGFPQGGVLLHGLEDVVEVVDDHLALDSTTAGLPGGMPVVPLAPACGSGTSPALPVCLDGLSGLVLDRWDTGFSLLPGHIWAKLTARL